MRARTVAVVAALTVLVAACGGDDGETADEAEAAGSDGTTAAGEGGSLPGDDFCADLEAFVGASLELTTSLLSGDQGAVTTAVAGLPAATSAIEATAPPELAEDVTVMVAAADAVMAADPTDPEAVGEAFQGSMAGEEAEAATTRLSDYARSECGFDPDEMTVTSGPDEATDGEPLGMGEAPEPPDPCTALEPQPVADAAGVTVDVADQDGSGDFDLGFWATRSCSYGNGAMTVSTVTFAGDVEQVRDDFAGTAESNGGSVVEADLGSLPDSTLVTSVDGMVSIHVFEAATPFGLAFAGVEDPATLVAAAEAAYAQTG